MTDFIYRPAPTALLRPFRQQARDKLLSIHIQIRSAAVAWQCDYKFIFGAVFITFVFPHVWPLVNAAICFSAAFYWQNAFVNLLIPFYALVPVLVVVYLFDTLWANWAVSTGAVKERSMLVPIDERVDAYFEHPREQALGEWAWATRNGKKSIDFKYYEAERHLTRFCNDLDANAADRADFAALPSEKQVEIICKRVLFLQLSAQ